MKIEFEDKTIPIQRHYGAVVVSDILECTSRRKVGEIVKMKVCVAAAFGQDNFFVVLLTDEGLSFIDERPISITLDEAKTHGPQKIFITKGEFIMNTELRKAHTLVKGQTRYYAGNEGLFTKALEKREQILIRWNDALEYLGSRESDGTLLVKTRQGDIVEMSIATWGCATMEQQTDWRAKYIKENKDLLQKLGLR